MQRVHALAAPQNARGGLAGIGAQGLYGAIHRGIDVARAAGLETLIAEVLSENAPMLKVFAKSGLPMTTVHDSEVIHVTLRLH